MNQPQQVNIKASDEDLKGKYANLMQVSHTSEEFIFDFVLLHVPEGHLVSRIITSPGHAKRIVAALQENIKRFEDSFGKIKESEAPQQSIGFQTK